MKNDYFFILIILCINIFLSNQFNLRNTASCQDYSFFATKDNVKIIGRYYQKDDITWITYSGSAIEFYASGNYVEFLLAGDNNILQEKDNRPRYAIYVDDELIIDTKMNDYEFIIKFKISNDETAKSKIKVMLLSENKNGGVGIKKIKINSCFDNEKIIVPTEKKKI